MKILFMYIDIFNKRLADLWTCQLSEACAKQHLARQLVHPVQRSKKLFIIHKDLTLHFSVRLQDKLF